MHLLFFFSYEQADVREYKWRHLISIWEEEEERKQALFQAERRKQYKQIVNNQLCN